MFGWTFGVWDSDPKVAAAAGYHVAGMSGIDFHANNPAYEGDGRVLDPARPETLVYAIAPDGRAVLFGALTANLGAASACLAISARSPIWRSSVF